jgi:hypothetical protein
MPTSRSKPASRNKRNRWVVNALIIYSAVCAGLLGYFLVFPDEATQKSQAEPSHLVQQGRYEGIIANWARYRARNLTAEAK